MEQQKRHPVLVQRDNLAARCLDLELEIITRDERIAELEAKVVELENKDADHGIVTLTGDITADKKAK